MNMAMRVLVMWMAIVLVLDGVSAQGRKAKNRNKSGGGSSDSSSDSSSSYSSSSDSDSAPAPAPTADDDGYHFISRCFPKEEFMDPPMSRRLAIEQELERHIEEVLRNPRRLQDLPNPLRIPINIHIVKGLNSADIGYEQIISQFRVLNEDFSATNDDYEDAGEADDFSGVAGNYEMQFSLNKIIRVDSTVAVFPDEANGVELSDMKFTAKGGSDIVDGTNIMNFWAADLSAQYLGFATFPGWNPDKDGVVVYSEAFGSKAYDHNNAWTILPGYNLGRTATHEVGHWLFLEHIWGDGNCEVDDGVEDTPVSAADNVGCPADNGGITQCGTKDMFNNFMDYVDDDCMNMFSAGQVARSQAIFLTDFANGGRNEFLAYVDNAVSEAFVDYFYFIYDDDECDAGHTKLPENLNLDSDGDEIYLCISYTTNPYVDVITDLVIVTGTSPTCPDTEYELIDSNLNEGNTLTPTYICYRKESQTTATKRIVDLTAFVVLGEAFPTDFILLIPAVNVATNPIYLATKTVTGSAAAHAAEPHHIEPQIERETPTEFEGNTKPETEVFALSLGQNTLLNVWLMLIAVICTCFTWMFCVQRSGKMKMESYDKVSPI
eukprot:CAMPEP_0202686560 /NCGR_PEP_ID=MMETSP1385-20130828/2303_1 /ASSEMBLY_ACC=CAM_ASM_000861 /TAXON_ID=933848 /ORGANISM="Elphidium margaritaceum" /LENGTH=604 /DNA_ID=CAMNT_0049341157 /DNA_START=122 /DNA_END=1936 /DNA_ORIENTATION=-